MLTGELLDKARQIVNFADALVIFLSQLIGIAALHWGLLILL